MGESKLGDLYLEKDESACRAFWCPPDGTPVLLCAMHLGSYETHTAIREAFANLAGTIAAKLDRRQFGCWTCTQPQAADARHCLSGFSDEDLMARLSPGGLPMFCCRVGVVGAWAAAQ
jgi:hypothetical protein